MSILIVLLSKRLELSLSEREVEHGEDGTELRNSDLALAELIEITEEFFDSHSLHDDEGLEAGLNIGGVVSNMDSWLKVAVFEHIDVSCGARVEEIASSDGCSRGFS